MESKVLKINNMNVRYHEWSEDRGLPTILCLHGLGSTSLSFIEIADYLCDYNLISVDLPGHGRSDGFNNLMDYTMDCLVEWLNNFVLEMKLQSFMLMAHSFGADIAIHYTLSFEGVVSRLILLDGGYYNKDCQYSYIKKMMNQSQWYGNGATTLEEECVNYFKDFNEYIFDNEDEYIELESKGYSRISNKLVIAIKDLMIEYEDKIKFAVRGEVAVGAIKAMYSNPSSILLSDIYTPTLLLVSTEPEQWYKLRIELLDLVSENDNFTSVEVPETSHFLHWDRPEVISGIIRGFIEVD